MKRQRSFLLTLTRTFLLFRFSLMVATPLGFSFLSFLNSLYLFFLSFAHLVKSNYIGIFFVVVRFFTIFYSFFASFFPFIYVILFYTIVIDDRSFLCKLSDPWPQSNDQTKIFDSNRNG
jgi:hypothetical protein